MQEYAQREFPGFASAYDDSSVPPPLFVLNPPQKGRLSLDCLDLIENAIHIDFGNQNDGEVLLAFNAPVVKSTTEYIDLQLSRRSSCWFFSEHPSTCVSPREMIIDIQLQTSAGFLNGTTSSMKSRYNLQFARCNAMDLPAEKLGFLPVMFETVRISLSSSQPVTGLKLRGQNGGTIILGNIRAYLQPTAEPSCAWSTAPRLVYFALLTSLIYGLSS